MKHLMMAALLLSACGDDDKKTTADTSTVSDSSATTDSSATDSNVATDSSVATDAAADSSVGTDAIEDSSVGTDAIADSSAPTDAAADGETTSACDRSGFTAVAQDFGNFGGYFLYLAQSSTGAPVSTLNMELLPTQGGLSEAGSVALTDANYDSCANCVLIYQDCDANLANCARTFLARAGQLTVDEFGESGGTFSGHLADVELVEVTVDDELHSTVVADGETWCIERYDFEAPVQ